MAQRGQRRNALRSLATLACVLLIYYGVPLDWGEGAGRVADIIRVILFIVGVIGVVWLLRQQVRTYLRARGERGQVIALLSTLYIVVTFFALFYYLLEVNSPGQFEGLETRTDSMYFTLVTLGTVGYGDIHAVGQLARAVNMVQVFFNIVVIGALLAVAAPGIAQRVMRKANEKDGVPDE